MSIEEVRALVAERQRYDDWLAALDAKRADTPLRVFERVHGDYVGRRADVIARLQSHIGELSTLGSDLEQRLNDLETRLSAHEEELAEGMLRNLVGEYDNDRWEAVRQDVEGKITALGGERDLLIAEVEDVRTLLASARVAPPAPETVTAAAEAEVALAVASPTPAVAPVVEATPLVVPAVEAEAVSAMFSDDAVLDVAAADPTPVVPMSTVPTPAASMPTLGMEELVPPTPTPIAAAEAVFDTAESTDEASADEDSLLDIDVSGIVENPVPQGQSHEDVLADVAALFDTSSIAAVPAPEPAAPTGPVSQSEVDDALAMFGEVTGPADHQFVQSLQGIEPLHDPRVDLSTATATPTGAPNANDPFDDLAFLRSVIDQGGAAEAPPAPTSSGAMSAPASGSEPQKTLRCTECGTMNLPTEWYCERCGGELAAF